MSVVRMIYVSVDPAKGAEAERVWKDHCAPLLTKQPGCLSEKLLKCTDSPGEYISYSEWDTQENIDRYRESQAHEEIRQHSRGLQGGGRPVVKRYEVK